MSERKPMTLEELRKAYDFSERIGAHVLLRVGQSECEGVIDHRDDDGICAVYEANGEWLKEKYYGKTWIAFAHEQPLIDRLAWKPCEKCRSCRTCIHAIESMSDSTGTCFWCDHMDKYKPMNFCPECGRPLTDAAWEMLERRLAGRE